MRRHPETLCPTANFAQKVPSFRGAAEGCEPGTHKHRPLEYRFRARRGACPRAARSADPGATPRNDGIFKLAAASVLVVLALVTHSAQADETAALYQASWAGLPAGELRLTLRDDPASYRGEIVIRTEGLPRLLTRFRASAVSAGRLAAARPPAPLRYDATYDLRKLRDRRLSMEFTPRAVGLQPTGLSRGTLVAERGAADTSRKPPLAEPFRTDVLDPLSALAAIRHALRQGNRGAFTIPVYDGTRRFDVSVRVLQKRDGDPTLHLALTLAPIAGFKGETSDDGDPDTAPRPVALTISDDQRLMPLSMSVSLGYLPLVVELRRWCSAAAPCPW
jgi:uncharacterized protein DUF3108